MNHTISIYTDGACSGNPGPGGWSAIIIFPDGQEVVLRGAEKDTTNNRMELSAVIAALNRISESSGMESVPITLYSDSQYVVKGVEWAKGWRKNNWVKSDGKPALNSELWETILNLIATLDVKFVWVRGHSGNEYNERCDRIAVEAALAIANGTFDEDDAPGELPPAPPKSFSECVDAAEAVWNKLTTEQQTELMELYFDEEHPEALLEKVEEYQVSLYFPDVKKSFLMTLGFKAMRWMLRKIREEQK